MIIGAIIMLSGMFLATVVIVIWLANEFIDEAGRERQKRQISRPEPIPGLSWWELQKALKTVRANDKHHVYRRYRIW